MLERCQSGASRESNPNLFRCRCDASNTEHRTGINCQTGPSYLFKQRCILKIPSLFNFLVFRGTYTISFYRFFPLEIRVSKASTNNSSLLSFASSTFPNLIYKLLVAIDTKLESNFTPPSPKRKEYLFRRLKFDFFKKR